MEEETEGIKVTEKPKVKFSNLSTPNKIAIVMAWVFGIINTIWFMMGFMSAI